MDPVPEGKKPGVGEVRQQRLKDLMRRRKPYQQTAELVEMPAVADETQVSVSCAIKDS